MFLLKAPCACVLATPHHPLSCLQPFHSFKGVNIAEKILNGMTIKTIQLLLPHKTLEHIETCLDETGSWDKDRKRMKLVSSSDSCFSITCCSIFFWGSFLREEHCKWQNIWSQITGGASEIRNTASWMNQHLPAWVAAMFRVTSPNDSWKLLPLLPGMPFFGLCTNFGLKTATTCKLHPGSLHHEIPMFWQTANLSCANLKQKSSKVDQS